MGPHENNFDLCLEVHERPSQSLNMACARNLAIGLALVAGVLSCIVGSQYTPDFLLAESPTCSAALNRVIDMQGFLESIGNRPLYTRERFEHVARQLEKARNGEEFELIDCYNETYVGIPKSGLVCPSSTHDANI
jgi:hypothetical protein